MNSTPSHDPTGQVTLAEEAAGRLLEAISILEAIERGQLLDALPKDADAARRHQCGVSLLAVLRRDLTALACDLQSASVVHAVMSRVRSVRPSD